MPSGFTVSVVVLLVVVGGSTGIVLASPVAQQGGGGPGGDDGGDGQRTPGGGDGRGTPGGGDGPGPNVSVNHRGPGNASISVRNAGTNRTVQLRFRRTVESPETGLRLREMTVTAGDPEYRLSIHTRARVSAGAERFPGAPPFGYLNVTHTVPNANVTNVTFTFTLNRTRLRERNVAAENVGLYRYRTENRTWQALGTRVRAQNRTHVTYRAVAPGLSEFAVAPTAAATTSTPTATATATPTPEPTARPSTPTPTPTPTSTATPMPGTDGSAPGFGPLAALLALAGFGVLARRR